MNLFFQTVLTFPPIFHVFGKFQFGSSIFQYLAYNLTVRQNSKKLFGKFLSEQPAILLKM